MSKSYDTPPLRANIRQIEAFNAVMRTGSVTEAAAALHVSQPAVSKLLRAFEEGCGFALFERRAGRLSPTGDARRLHAETERLGAGLARVARTARAIRDLERGELSVVGYPALSLRLLPTAAARFLAERPGTRMALATRPSRGIAEAMLPRSADLGFSLVRSEDPGIACSAFTRSALVCALPPGHPLVAGPEVALADLARLPLIALGPDDLSMQVIRDAFARAGLEMQVGLEAEMAESACTLVRAGLGPALVPALCAAGWRSDEVVFRPIRPSASQQVWCYTRSGAGPQPLADRFCTLLRAELDRVEAPFRDMEHDPGSGMTSAARNPEAHNPEE